MAWEFVDTQSQDIQWNLTRSCVIQPRANIRRSSKLNYGETRALNHTIYQISLVSHMCPSLVLLSYNIVSFTIWNIWQWSEHSLQQISCKWIFLLWLQCQRTIHRNQICTCGWWATVTKIFRMSRYSDSELEQIGEEIHRLYMEAVQTTIIWRAWQNSNIKHWTCPHSVRYGTYK